MPPWRPRPMIVDMHCTCGARYERTEKAVLACDHDSAVCGFCGAGLAAWRGGSVCLNSSLREDKWCPAGFRLLRIAAAG